ILGANIIVHPENGVSVKTVSDAKGEFKLSLVDVEQIKSMQLSHLTYKTVVLKKNKFKIDNKFIVLLVPVTKGLEEVDIEVDAPIRKLKGDTIDYELSHIKYGKNIDAYEALFLLSEIKLKDGKIFSNGQEVVKVTVDGRPFFTSDPMTLFKILPAEAIKKIQLVDGMNEEDSFMGYDSGERQKEINVVLKDDMKNGVFGRQIAGIGSSRTYKTNTEFNLFRGKKRFSAILNNNNINDEVNTYSSLLRSGSVSNPKVRKRSLNVNFNGDVFNYFNVDMEAIIKQDKGEIETYKERSLFSAELDQLKNRETKLSSTSSPANIISLRLYNSRPTKTKIMIEPKINMAKIRQTSSSTFDNSIDDSLSSSTRNNSSMKGDAMLLEGKAILSRIIKPGKSNIGISYNMHRDENNSSLTNETFDRLKPNSSRLAAYSQNMRTISRNESVKIVYSHLFNKGVKGYLAYERLKSNYLLRNESISLSDSTLSGSDVDSVLSNNTKWKQKTHKAYGNINFSNNRFMFASNIGFFSDFLYADMLPERRFSYLNALVNSSYTIAADKNFTLSYTHNNNIPSIQQLQEFVYVENPLNIYSGNTTLNPQVNNRLNIGYTFLNTSSQLRMNFMSEIEFVNNRITNSILNLQRDSVVSENLILPSGSQVFKFINFGNAKSIRNSISANFPFFKKGWLLDLELSNMIREYPMLIDAIETKNQLNSTNFKIELGNRTINSSSISYQISFDNASFNSYSNIINHRLLLNLNHNYGSNSRFSSNIEYRRIGGGTENSKTSFLLCNVGFETKVVKNLMLSVLAYDIFNNYRNEQRTFNESYSETQRTNFLGNYVMVNLTYIFRRFGGS
ncbi:MAG TPA: outer membrane beta-barrel protein, partial [Pseudosphingobacterium sp.]|nr:outer membrane beta-barrel protein [Pseudosphingobacterium sp.]